MNYKSSFYLSNIVFIYILFLLASCTTKRLATTPNVILIPLNNDPKQGESYEVRVDYKGLKDCNYEFEVYIRNKSKDSVFVNPDLFRYSFISENNEKDKNIIHSISPEEKIKQLKIQEDSLKNEENPYALTDKSSKAILIEGLARGTVAVLFGQDAEELEIQRQEDEYDWKQKHNLKLSEINKELDFWNNSVLLPSIIPPKNEVIGKVLFSNCLDTKEIEIGIPLQYIVYEFRFKPSH